MSKEELMKTLLDLYPRRDHMNKIKTTPPYTRIIVDYHIRKLELQLIQLLGDEKNV